MQSAPVRAERVEPRLPPPVRQDDPVAAIKAALILLEGGQPAAAVEALDRLKPLGLDNAAACGLAGLICVSTGMPRKALAWLDRALALGPAEAALLGHKAHALAALGERDKALEAYEAAVAAGTVDPAIRFGQARLLREAGRLAEAIAVLDVVVQLRPAYPEALALAGGVMAELDQPEAALRLFDEALRLRQNDPASWLGKIDLLRAQGRQAEVLESCDQGLFHLPGTTALLGRRAGALLALGRLEEADGALDAVLAACPDDRAALLDRGDARLGLGRPEEALLAFERADALDADAGSDTTVRAAAGQGLALFALGRHAEALAQLERALNEDPSWAPARACRGQIRLLQGDFARGWPDYEFRLAAGRQPRPSIRDEVPVWTGERCRGARLAVLADGTDGERIQFARLLPLLAMAGAVVTLVCPAALHPLFETIAAGQMRMVETVAEDELFDLQVCLTSLPACLRVTAETIPAAAGYLAAEAGEVAAWRRRRRSAALAIGLCWRGDGAAATALPLEAFAALGATPDTRLVALNTVEAGEAEAAAALRLDLSAAELGGSHEGLAELAAVVAGLDLVVTCDATVAHLAGALGRPVWVLLPSHADWRWMLEVDESPWYASMRLFRQAEPGRWAEPVDILTRAVADWASAWRTHCEATERNAGVSARLSRGEAVDRLGALVSERERDGDPASHRALERAIAALEEALTATPADARIDEAADKLRRMHRVIAMIVAEMRECERQDDFGSRFVELARALLTAEGLRAALRQAIDAVAESEAAAQAA